MTDETKTNAADKAFDQQDTELSDQTLDNVAGGAHTVGGAGAASKGMHADPHSGGGGPVNPAKKRRGGLQED